MLYLKRFLILCCLTILVSGIYSATGEIAAAQEGYKQARPELLKLAEEFRQFRSPIFPARNWRPTHRVEGVPDYAAVVKAQREGLPKFREQLKGMDTSGWPVDDKVDYLVLRTEMDDVYFEHWILKETETNPMFYIQQAINGVSRTMGSVVPYTTETAETIIAAFERTKPIIEQGPKNLVLANASADLAKAGMRYIKDIRQKYAAGVKLLEPHFPEAHRQRLAKAAEEAAMALENYGNWVEANMANMKGQPHVGRRNLEWRMKRVHLCPWSIDELLFMGEIEKNRFLISIEMEEHKNKGLKELTMPTTEEWIEWFRLTYLQTKYWLKDNDILSFYPYVGESYLEPGVWQEPFGGVGNRPGLMGFPTEPKPEPSKRLFVVPEDNPFTQTYWERTMRLDPITDYQHSDWPGHYFEPQVTRRNPNPIRAHHRETGFSEGWSHWFEEFFLDMDYPFLRGPRTRELTYNFLLLRAVRIPLDIGLSTGELSMDEAVQYQIDRVPSMEQHISQAEVDLYVRYPYQAQSYIVGKKQLEQLLADRIMQLGYSIDWREFYDSLLDHGAIPLTLTRWELTGYDDQIKELWDVPDTPEGMK